MKKTDYGNWIDVTAVQQEERAREALGKRIFKSGFVGKVL